MMNGMRGRLMLACAALVAAAIPALSSGAAASPLPSAPNCAIFPATNVWNKRVDGLPVAANSAAMILAFGVDAGLHPDFGSYLGYGIPFNVASSATPKVPVRFQYRSESNPGPYPIPAHPRIEAGSDHHLLIVDKSTCTLYEMWAVRHTATGWSAGSGAIWNMESNHLRHDGWTSADAAGLPILPGLARYQEDVNGVIDHALRFTAPRTCAGHIYPARHDAGSGSCAVLPPMGLRLRLRADYPVNSLPPQCRPIAIALQRYGMILADNGSPWYVSGVSDKHWNDSQLHLLNQITGRDLVVVDTSTLRNG
jgi:hypothetical protein